MHEYLKEKKIVFFQKLYTLPILIQEYKKALGKHQKYNVTELTYTY